MTSHRTVGMTPANHQRDPRSRGPKRTLLLLGSFILALNLMMVGSAAAQNDASSPEASPAATPAADANRLELTFEELNDSGISGTATLYEAGAQTIVEVELEGAGDNHPSHVHEGTCDEIQPESAWDLANVVAGTSSSIIDVPLSDLLDGEYVIDLHLAPNQLGLLIGCAAIEGTITNAEGTPVAVGGEGTEAASTEAPATEAVTTEEATATEAVSTEEATTAVETTEPATTEATTVTPTEPAATEASDGTGGMLTDSTPTGDGTAGGKGFPLTPTPSPTQSAVGGATDDGDGTAGDKAGVGSGKGVPITTTSNLPASTGSGDSLLLPTSPMGTMLWATGGFALVLLGSGLLMRRAEHQQRPGRWRRLGL